MSASVQSGQGASLEERRQPPRHGLDEQNLVLEGARKRRRTEGSPDDQGESKGNGTRSGRGPVDDSGLANPATAIATDAAGFEDVRRRGLLLSEKMSTLKDSEGRLSHFAFLELPSREEYADYYEIIKKPMSYLEIRKKLDKREYASIAEVRNDFNQIFVNAKRYNSPLSPIFLDAKRLHKVMKEYYEVLTGEVALPEEDEPPLPTIPSLPPPPMAKSLAIAMATASPAPTGSHAAFAKRGPTLKPWLTKKLGETMNLKDAAGRSYADGFLSLPDRKAWAEYYKVITHPMSLDVVASKVIKRYYLSVEQFVEDMNVIFANAQFFNEESSRIWKDAKIMQMHFMELMKEVPPVFVPPRKYNTVKRRAEMDAIAQGLPIPAPPPPKRRNPEAQSGSEPPDLQPPGGEYDDESGEDDYGDSYPSYASPFDLPMLIKPEDMGLPMVDTYATPGHSRSPSGTPGQLPYPPAHHTPTYPVVSSLASGSEGYAQPSGLQASLNGSIPPSPSSSSFATPIINGINTGSASTPQGSPPLVSEEPPKSRLVAKLPTSGDLPVISRFLVRTHPSTLLLTLNNDRIRQHSFAISSTSERVEFIPFFRRVEHKNAKGKGRATSLSLDGPRMAPKITTSVRPKATHFETIAEPPSSDGPTHHYSLIPKPGLTVVEFVVTLPGTTGEDSPSEVYRVYLTK